MRRRIANRWIRTALFVSVLVGPAALAQSQSTGQVEIAIFGGGSYLRVEGEGSTKGAFGGRVGVAANRRILAFGEASFYPMGDVASVRALRGCPPNVCPGAPILFQESHVSGHLWDFSGGVHVNLTSGESKLAPYALGTLGAGRASADGSFSVRSGTMISQFRMMDVSDTALGVGGGGGLRYYVGQRWGFQPEVRYARYFFEDAGLNNLRFTIGFFYRFGG